MPSLSPVFFVCSLLESEVGVRVGIITVLIVTHDGVALLLLVLRLLVFVMVVMVLLDLVSLLVLHSISREFQWHDCQLGYADHGLNLVKIIRSYKLNTKY